MASVAGNQRVVVAVRTRPVLSDGASFMHSQEKFELPAVRRMGDTAVRVELTKPGEPVKSSTFNFDYIFDQESTQLEVYEDCVVDMVDAALVGVNASLLAYGQTGSGKTFSVLGDVKANPLENDLLTVNSGIFLRVLSDLMDTKIRKEKMGWHVVIGLSCVEIYNENIRDLFGGDRNAPPPPIKAVMIGDDVILPNLITKELTTLQAVFTEIQLAIARRASRATESNAASSRSHCLFFIDILQRANTAPKPSLDLIDSRNANGEKGGAKRSIAPASPTKQAAWEMPFQGTMYHIPGQKEPVYGSKIILADLAGSERISRSGVSGLGLAEATSINSSLTALGNVVHSLHEGGYVSYRTSNLTRLLKPTFSHPSSRVLLLAQCAPTQLTFEETVSTLHFANKVKAMKVTTVTGTQAEKLQFDFLEVSKNCEAIGSDLRIFAMECDARPSVIRRNHPRHKLLYYDCIKGSGKDRAADMEASGLFAAARAEREAARRYALTERSRFEATLKDEVEREKNKMALEHSTKLKELGAEVATLKQQNVRHKLDMLLQESATKKTSLQLEESAAWSRLLRTFYVAHKSACTRELERQAQRIEQLSKALVHSQAVTPAAERDSLIGEADGKYALSAWYHCVSKRSFAALIELHELQMCWLTARAGNYRLTRWQQKNGPKK